MDKFELMTRIYTLEETIAILHKVEPDSKVLPILSGKLSETQRRLKTLESLKYGHDEDTKKVS
jgi:hypothetical protein